jgi:hypothetical protein
MFVLLAWRRDVVSAVKPGKSRAVDGSGLANVGSRMNIIACIIGGFIGVSLGVVGTLVVMLPKLNDAERRIDNLLEWDDDWQAQIARYERKHNHA